MNTDYKDNFSKLEKLFNTDILFLNPLGYIKSVKTVLKTISTQPADKPITLLIKTASERHWILKLWQFVYTSLQYRYLKFKLSKFPKTVTSSYGVYPKVEDPFAIYQLDTTAEEYTNSNILPVNEKSLKGLATWVLSIVSGYHASTAGIVILIHKKS